MFDSVRTRFQKTRVAFEPNPDLLPLSKILGRGVVGARAFAAQHVWDTLHPGELVRVTATTGVEGLDGEPADTEALLEFIATKETSNVTPPAHSGDQPCFDALFS